jgi:Clostridium P-47 protein
LNDGSADTYGWDTVYAVRIDDVNRMIGGTGAIFVIEGTDPITSGEYVIDAVLEAWSVTTGGSGELLNLLLPIASVTFASSNGNLASFSDGNAVVQVSLEFILAGSAADRNGTSQNLKIKTSSGSSAPVATILSLSFSDTTFPRYQPVIQAALQTWINANVEKLGGIFATVNLDRTADQGAFQFLYPTAVSYAYIDRGTLDTSLLGVLCMTGNRSAAGLQSQISPNAIPDGARAGFLISQDRFLEDLIAPALPSAFPGLAEGDFQPDDQGGLTARGGVLRPVVHENTAYPVALTSGSVTITDTELTVAATTSTLVNSLFGIYALCQSSATYQIQLRTQSSGAQTLGFQEITQSADHSTQETAKTAITEDVAKLALALVGLILGVLTDGIALVIGGLIIGLLTGVVQNAPDAIENANTDAAPSIDALMSNTAALIAWSDTADFRLTSAALNGSLQFGGTITAT